MNEQIYMSLAEGLRQVAMAEARGYIANADDVERCSRSNVALMGKACRDPERFQDAEGIRSNNGKECMQRPPESETKASIT